LRPILCPPHSDTAEARSASGLLTRAIGMPHGRGLHRSCRARPADPTPGRGGPERRRRPRPDETRTPNGPRWVRMTPRTPGSRRARAVTTGILNPQVNTPSPRPSGVLEESDGGFEPLIPQAVAGRGSLLTRQMFQVFTAGRLVPPYDDVSYSTPCDLTGPAWSLAHPSPGRDREPARPDQIILAPVLDGLGEPPL
jgi:hypothetical protein